MEDASDVCRFCPKEGAIKYYYLSVCDKDWMWCSSEPFCAEITAHWEEITGLIMIYWMDDRPVKRSGMFKVLGLYTS